MSYDHKDVEVAPFSMLALFARQSFPSLCVAAKGVERVSDRDACNCDTISNKELKSFLSSVCSAKSDGMLDAHTNTKSARRVRRGNSIVLLYRIKASSRSPTGGDARYLGPS